MKTNAAILWEFGGNWEVEEIDLDPPQDGEVLVSWEPPGCATPMNTSAPATCPPRCR
jgi:Zn-dependent alcohol dehydrogenase